MLRGVRAILRWSPSFLSIGACAGGERCVDVPAGASSALASPADPSPESDPSARARPLRPTPAGFLKGQLHMHTNGSGDSRTPPAVAVDWYARRGFDFVVITDHNRVTEVEAPPEMLVLRGMELTQNLRTCEPPPVDGGPCLLHTSALFLSPGPRTVSFPLEDDASRLAIFTRALDVAARRGAISVLNHPNFRHAADADLVAKLAEHGLRFIEIENRAVDSMNEGDATTPSTEALWDRVLTSGARVFGTASDDAHHYLDIEEAARRGETAYVGDRGWVMVRAQRDERSIRAAMEQGDFYASTGVIFETLKLSRERITASVGEEVTFEVLGIDGKTLHETVSRTLDFPIPRNARGYVRLRAVDALGQKALAQPVFLETD